MLFRKIYRFTSPALLCCLIFLCASKAARSQTAGAGTDSNAQSLDTVTVSGARRVLERRADRVIFNVENSVTAQTGDALSALKKAPGVQVSGRGEISMAGKSSVKVMLDNRLVQVDGEELTALLQSIPAAQLARIEIISTPPARYDAEGNSGIVHIVTKRQARNGFNGNVSATYMRNDLNSPSTAFNLNYRRGKLNVYGNGGLSRWQALIREDYSVATDSTQWYQRGRTEERTLFSRNQLGIDFAAGPSSNIGFLYTLGFGGPHWNSGEDIRSGTVLPGGGGESSLTQALNKDHGLRNVANLNYEWRMDSLGRKLTAEAEYFNRRGRRDRRLLTTAFDASGQRIGSLTDNNTTGEMDINTAFARVDMSLPTAFAKLEYGLKASFIHNLSDNLFQTFNGYQYETDYGKTNRFDYKENTQSAYLSANHSAGSWEMQAGLRAENTQTEGYSPTLNQRVSRRYLQLFPTGYVQYTPNEEHSFNLSVNRRIERPSFWLLNPFRTYTSLNSYETGNPFLQPSYSLNASLAYTLHEDYSFTFTAGRVTDMQVLIKSADTATQAFIFYEANAGTASNYSLNAAGSWQPFSWWECDFDLTGSYSSFGSSYFAAGQPLQYARIMGYADIDNTFTLNRSKTLFAELEGEFQSAQQSDFEVQRANMNISAGIKVQLLQKRLTLELEANDIFRTNTWRLYNLYNGAVTNSYYGDRYVSCTLGWKFGSTSLKPTRERQSSEEQGRAR